MRAPESQRNASNLLGHIALALFAFTVIAFGLKAAIHTEVQARYTPLVIVHALSMLAWIGLLATQAYLAAGSWMGVHRTLGRTSPALVVVMTVSGVIISWNIGLELGRPEVTIVNIAAFATFLPLYGAALWFARRREIHSHRQAMLIGTLAFMTPAYARIIQVLDWPDPIAIAVQPPITIAIAVAYDWVTLGRITRPVLVMLGYSVGLVVLMAALLAALFL